MFYKINQLVIYGRLVLYKNVVVFEFIRSVENLHRDAPRYNIPTQENVQIELLHTYKDLGTRNQRQFNILVESTYIPVPLYT